jgi:hypothetical protein
MFAAGRVPIDAYREQPRKQRVVYSTVWRVWNDWRSERDATRTAIAVAVGDDPSETEPSETASTTEGQLALALTSNERDADLGDDPVTPDEDGGDIVPMTAQPVRSYVDNQYPGTFVMRRRGGSPSRAGDVLST